MNAQQRVKHSATGAEALGDFTTTARVIPISLMAIGIGLVSSCVAWLLLKLIGLFTNLFYYQRLSTAFVSPAGNHLGPYAILVPVVGSLIVGLMARYGSERIRGHGIPEAIESILMNGSRVRPRLAILKPLSAAISDRNLLGVVTRNQLLSLFEKGEDPKARLGDIARRKPVVAHPEEPLRVVVYRMAESGFTRLPVVDSRHNWQLVGMISLRDLLQARTRNLEEERARQRVLRLRMPFGRQDKSATVALTEDSDFKD